MDLEKLRKNLPRGSREILAKKFGVSIGHIHNVLTNRRKNDLIILAAIDLVAKQKEQLSEATEFINSL